MEMKNCINKCTYLATVVMIPLISQQALWESTGHISLQKTTDI